MRISDLSRRSGVPVATIKFYLRDGLLHAGTRTAHNQAEYNDTHLSRLRFVRMLTGIAKLSLSQVREVLAAVDKKGQSVQGLCLVVNRALDAAERVAPQPDGDGGIRAARASVDRFLGDLGWQVSPDAPGRDTLAQVLEALRQLGWDCDVEIFGPLADAAERLTSQEGDIVPVAPAETVVARTVLYEIAFTTMRRMAQEHFLTASPVRDQPLPSNNPARLPDQLPQKDPA